MIRTPNTKGFTLIELLVVITIIGILAVGGTTAYTSNIQKARDTSRINDVKSIQGSLEQVFSDLAVYPDVKRFNRSTTKCTTEDTTDISLDCIVSTGYMTSLPKDSKSGQSGNGSPLDYTYNVGPKDSVVQQTYEVSTGLENAGNLASKWANTVDGGNDNKRYEISNTNSLVTSISADNTMSPAAADSAASTKINAASCVGLGTQTASTSTAGGTAVVIKGNCAP